MKILASIGMTILAGGLLGYAAGWAADAKLNPAWAIPFAFIIIGGVFCGAVAQHGWR